MLGWRSGSCRDATEALWSHSDSLWWQLPALAAEAGGCCPAQLTKPQKSETWEGDLTKPGGDRDRTVDPTLVIVEDP